MKHDVRLSEIEALAARATFGESMVLHDGDRWITDEETARATKALLACTTPNGDEVVGYYHCEIADAAIDLRATRGPRLRLSLYILDQDALGVRLYASLGIAPPFRALLDLFASRRSSVPYSASAISVDDLKQMLTEVQQSAGKTLVGSRCYVGVRMSRWHEARSSIVTRFILRQKYEALCLVGAHRSAPRRI